MKKVLVLGIVFLFLLVGIYPSTAIDTVKKTYNPLNDGNTLYVGGSGPGNYTKIQDAIDNASYGDTINVYNGTYYGAIRVSVENLKIIGEGRDVTFIDANSTGKAVKILQSFVVIKGFTIIGKNYCIHVAGDLNSITISDNNLSEIFCAVEFEFYGDNKYNILENNVFYSNSCSIDIGGYYDNGFNIIRNNTFIDNWEAVLIGGKNNEILNNRFYNCRNRGVQHWGEKSTIKNNIFIGNDIGLEVQTSIYWESDNTVIGNHFENNRIGLVLDAAYNTLVTQNNFINNKIGLELDAAKDTSVTGNNFIKNKKHATFFEKNKEHGNVWKQNYWGLFPYLIKSKFILGRLETDIERVLFSDPWNPRYYIIPWLNFDMQPVKKPYDI